MKDPVKAMSTFSPFHGFLTLHFTCIIVATLHKFLATIATPRAIRIHFAFNGGAFILILFSISLSLTFGFLCVHKTKLRGEQHAAKPRTTFSPSRAYLQTQHTHIQFPRIRQILKPFIFKWTVWHSLCRLALLTELK